MGVSAGASPEGANGLLRPGSLSLAPKDYTSRLAPNYRSVGIAWRWGSKLLQRKAARGKIRRGVSTGISALTFPFARGPSTPCPVVSTARPR